MKQTLTTLSHYSLIEVSNKPTHKCDDIIIGYLFDLTMVSIRDLLLHFCIKSFFNVSVPKPFAIYRTVGVMASIDRPSLIAEPSNVSVFICCKGEPVF